MTDANTFNFENYDQGQAVEFGNEQVLPPIQGDTQFLNQNEAQIDPNAFFQGDNNVLQETAGMGGETVNEEIFNQNNTYQDNTMDTNAIFGETLKTGTEVPEFGQGFQATTTNTTTNVIEGNTFFEDTNQAQIQEANIDPNAFLSNQNFENIDTNAFYNQAQTNEKTAETFSNIDTNAFFNQPQEKKTKIETTTETKTFFNQAQEIQPQFGENQFIQGADTSTNTFFDANPQDFGQIQTQTQQTEVQNVYSAYPATKTQELNTFGYGTNEEQAQTVFIPQQPEQAQPVFIPQQQEQVQPVFNPEPQPNVETPPPPFFAPSQPVTQTQTTTTTTTFGQNPVLPPSTPQFQNKVLDFEAYPASNAPVRQTPIQPIKPQFDMAQFQQALDATPLTTSTTLIQPEPQFVPQNQQPVTIQQVTPPPTQVVPQPNIQATYTPTPITTTNPRRVVQRRFVTRTAAKPVTYIQATNPSTQVIPTQTYQTTTATANIPTTTQYVQPVQTTTVPTTTQYVQPVQTTTVPTTTQYVQPVQTTTVPTTTQYVQPVQTTTVPTATQYVQTGKVPGYQYINKLIDEDFKRGRPIYGDNALQPNKMRLNQVVNTPTYKIRDISEMNKNNIGLSKLGAASSYNNFRITPAFNKLNPALNTINTPNITTPTITTPTLTNPKINVPNITTPTLNVPNITTPTLNVPNVTTPTLNVQNITTPTINVPNITTPTITTPTITTPTLNVPNVTTPTINVPNVTTPTLNVPNITTPTINVPNVTTPTLNVPNVTTPTLNVPNVTTPTLNVPNVTTPTLNVPNVTTPTLNVPNVTAPTLNDIITPGVSNNLVNNLNNNINTLNTNIGNNVNNAVGNINTGLDKLGKASSYNVGANTITPLLNNAGLQTANIASDNTRLPQLKDFL